MHHGHRRDNITSLIVGNSCSQTSIVTETLLKVSFHPFIVHKPTEFKIKKTLQNKTAHQLSVHWQLQGN